MRPSAFLALICLLSALLSAGAAFAQAPKPASKGLVPKSAAEGQAVNAVILAQQNPDDLIKAADALISKFADTVFKSFALELEAEAYQQKGDNTKAIVYAEQALQADPKNYDADNLLANITAQTTRDTALDKTEKLARAEKYAHDALDILATGAKPALYANNTDEQWAKRKGEGESLSWQALGTVALVRKKPDEAIADFQKGVDANPDPVLMIRTGRALLAANKPDDAVTWFDKAMNAPNVAAQIKSIAQADKDRVVKAKGATAPK